MEDLPRLPAEKKASCRDTPLSLKALMQFNVAREHARNLANDAVDIARSVSPVDVVPTKEMLYQPILLSLAYRPISDALVAAGALLLKIGPDGFSWSVEDKAAIAKVSTALFLHNNIVEEDASEAARLGQPVYFKENK